MLTKSENILIKSANTKRLIYAFWTVRRGAERSLQKEMHQPLYGNCSVLKYADDIEGYKVLTPHAGI